MTKRETALTTCEDCKWFRFGRDVNPARCNVWPLFIPRKSIDKPCALFVGHNLDIKNMTPCEKAYYLSDLAAIITDPERCFEEGWDAAMAEFGKSSDNDNR